MFLFAKIFINSNIFSLEWICLNIHIRGKYIHIEGCVIITIFIMTLKLFWSYNKIQNDFQALLSEDFKRVKEVASKDLWKFYRQRKGNEILTFQHRWAPIFWHICLWNNAQLWHQVDWFLHLKRQLLALWCGPIALDVEHVVCVYIIDKSIYLEWY